MPSAAFKKALANVTKKVSNVISNPFEAAKFLKLSSPRLNYVLGGQLKLNCIHRIIGPESSGKSTICNYIAGEIQRKVEGHPYCIYWDAERSFLWDHAQENGLLLDEDHFIYLTPNNIEEATLALEEFVRTGEIGSIIIDSESMISTKAVLEDEFNKANFGAVAKALKEFIIRFTPLCANFGTTMFIISQERAQLQMMSHAINTTGGYALKYAGSTLNRAKKVETITVNGKDVGIRMNIRNYKNKTGIPWRNGNMDLYFKGGFDYTIEYVDYIKDLAEDERLKPFITVGSTGMYKSEKFDISIRGKDSFISWVKDPTNKDAWDKIKEKIDEIIANSNSIDNERVEMDDYEKALLAEAKEVERLEKNSIDNVELDNDFVN